MVGNIDGHLARLGIELPQVSIPVANYVPFMRDGATLYVSGQVSMSADGLVVGKLGDDMDVEAGAAAARLCGAAIAGTGPRRLWW